MQRFFKNPEKEGAKKIYLETALYLLAVSLCVAIFFISGELLFFFPLMAIASAFFAMAMIKGGQSLGLIYLIFASVILFFFTDKLWELLLIISLFLPVGTALFVSVSYKKRFNSSIASSFLASAIFMGVDIIVFTWENSNPFSFDTAFSDIFASVKEVIGISFDIISQSPYSAYITVGREEYISSMFSQALFYVPILYSVITLVMVLLSNRITKWLYGAFADKPEEKIPGAFVRLRYFRLSVAGGVFYVLANFIYLFVSGDSVTGLLIGMFVSVMAYVLAFEGIAVLISFMAIKEVKQIFRVLAGIASVILCLLPLGIIESLFILTGLMDCFYNLRRFFNGKGGRIL